MTQIGDQELVREFLVESYDNLEQLDRDVVALGQDPGDRETLSEIFRSLHTLKGTCGFLSFSKLGAVALAGETLLSKLREGELTWSQEMTSTLLRMVDTVRYILANIERGGDEGTGTYTQIVADLEALQQGDTIAPLPLKSAADVERGGDAERDTLVTAVDAGRTVRVDAKLLDSLTSLGDELTLLRDEIAQLALPRNDAAISGAFQKLGAVTTELRGGLMKARVLPVGTIWGEVPRIVREMSRSLGKHVRVEMEGETTKLDHGVLESVKEPLTQLVRHCIAHGIETPEARTSAGKPDAGCVSLRAYPRQGRIVIEIADDSSRTDVEPIPRESDGSDRGKSGVELDVVRENIEAIGGTLEVVREVGQGSTFRMAMPVTHAFIPAHIVAAGGGRYAIPESSVLEVVRLEATGGEFPIEYVCDAPVYRFRGELLPLVDLSEYLGVTGRALSSRAARSDVTPSGTTLDVMVLRANDARFGLVVDAAFDTDEIVVKPLGQPLDAIEDFAGAAILSNGDPAFILDAECVARRSRVSPQGSRLKLAVDGRQEWRSFAIGGLDLCLPVDTVHEVVPYQRMMPVPHALKSVHGVFSFHGEVVTAIDLRACFGLAPYGPDDEPMNIVVAGDDRRVSVLVDRVGELFEADNAAIDATPGTVDSAFRNLIAGVHQRRGRLSLALSLDAVIERAQTPASS